MKIEKNSLTHQLSIWLTTTAEGIQYTCPMHSHILQSESGFCTICGMALEPVIPAGIEKRFSACGTVYSFFENPPKFLNRR